MEAVIAQVQLSYLAVVGLTQPLEDVIDLPGVEVSVGEVDLHQPRYHGAKIFLRDFAKRNSREFEALEVNIRVDGEMPEEGRRELNQSPSSTSVGESHLLQMTNSLEQRLGLDLIDVSFSQLQIKLFELQILVVFYDKPREDFQMIPDFT